MARHIEVTVQGDGDHNLRMVWRDPRTGKRVTRSTRTTDTRRAERMASELQQELNANRGILVEDVTFEEFRERFFDEYLATAPRKTFDGFKTALGHVERVLTPLYVNDIDTSAISHLKARLLSEKAELTADFRQPSTVKTHLNKIRTALRWANRMGMLAQVPHFDIPKVVQDRPRPMTGEEFDRFLAAIEKVRNWNGKGRNQKADDAHLWQRFSRGLWHSGMRLDEAARLSWDPSAKISVDIESDHPALLLRATSHKGRVEQERALTPEMIKLLEETPASERSGPVFPLPVQHPGRLSKLMGDFARAAGIKIDRPAHSMKRAFITRLRKLGLDVDHVMLYTGNKDPATIRRHYLRLDVKDAQRALASLRTTSRPRPEVSESRPKPK